MRGVTPLATRSRRLRVSPGKRRAAQPAAHLTASRGLTSRPLGGRAEHVHRSVRTDSAIGTRRDGSCGVFAMQRQQKHTLCRRRFGKFCAQLTLFARHLPVLECRLTAHARPVPDKSAVSCGFGSWSARVAHPRAAIVERAFFEQARRNCGGIGTEVLPHVLQAKRCRAQRTTETSPSARVSRRRPTHRRS